MALFGAPGGTKTRNEMTKGLKYPHSFDNEKIAETYEKLAKSVVGNGDIKIGERLFFCASIQFRESRIFNK